MTARKSKRGGRRAGAGRPASDTPARTVSIRLTDQLRAEIDDARGETPLGEWVRAAIERRLLDCGR